VPHLFHGVLKMQDLILLSNMHPTMQNILFGQNKTEKEMIVLHFSGHIIQQIVLLHGPKLATFYAKTEVAKSLHYPPFAQNASHIAILF
jgi:hypothetical protein